MFKFIISLFIISLSVPAVAEQKNDKPTFSVFGSSDKKEKPDSAEGEKEAVPGKLPFVDEGANNASFKAFRETLMQKIEEKDANFIRDILDPAMQFNFGGPSDFTKFYGLDGEMAKTSIFWKDIKNVMVLGSSVVEGEICAPYVFCNWPDSARDTALAAIIGDNVEMKNEPKKDAKTVATLNRNIVKTLFSSAALRAGWVHVKTMGGAKGFVPKSSVRSPTEYRIFFKQKGDKWFITTFISGNLVY